jgi:hypothetical protein
MGNAKHPRTACTTLFAAWALVVVFANLPAIAATPSSVAVQSTPRLAGLEIDIWPDYDRPAALVILKAELAADVKLPATISLRIPASSGGPAAVAYADEGKTGLFNLNHERTSADGFITLHFQAPQRYIHVEFYDPILKTGTGHSYSYVWPGDMAVARVSVRLQEPAGASAISVEPNLGAGIDGPDGLLYRKRTLGAVEAGARLPIEVRYTKRDSRTSAEIMGVKSAPPAPQTASDPGPGLPPWIFGLVSLTLVSLVAVGISLWWHRRTSVPVAREHNGRFCSRCGAAVASSDRFCAACGTRVRDGRR